jgi:tetratricopeptide (TPR) repeat protein
MERAVDPPRRAHPEMVYRHLGNFLLKSERYGEAKKAFRKAELSAGGTNYVGYQAYAAACQGLNEEAISLYRRALIQEPLEGEDRVRTYLNLGQLLEALGRHQEAARELESALSLDPRNSRALLVLGKIDEALGAMEEAEEMYSKAVDSSTDRVTPLLNLIDFYRRRGRPAEALPPAWKLVQLEPDETAYRDLLRQLQADIERGRR